MPRVVAQASPKSFGGLAAFTLSEFVTERWQYRAGQHTTVLAPTDWGKTHLVHTLLDKTATPDLPCMSLVLKPRDKTVTQFNRELGLKRQYTWPPPAPMPWARQPRGWSVWPRSSEDSEQDEITLYRVMSSALRWAYAQGGREGKRHRDLIVFADETAGLVELPVPSRNDIPLERRLRPLWTRGRSLGVGMWAATQRPVDIPLHAYSQAQHLFLGNDPDARGRKRFGEIGGVDPKMVERVTAMLQPWQWLYIRRTRPGPRYCVIVPD